MAGFTPSKKTAQDFNNNTQYVNDIDSVQADTINNLVESALYTQDVADKSKSMAESVRALAINQPDVSEAGDSNKATQVLIIDRQTAPRFKFIGLKGEQGEQGEKGEQGEQGFMGLSIFWTMSWYSAAWESSLQTHVISRGDVYGYENAREGDVIVTRDGTVYYVVGQNEEYFIVNPTSTNVRGERGPVGAVPIVSITASVSETTGTPEVTVQQSGTNEAPLFAFEFSGLKGEQGEQGETNETATEALKVANEANQTASEALKAANEANETATTTENNVNETIIIQNNRINELAQQIADIAKEVKEQNTIIYAAKAVEAEKADGYTRGGEIDKALKSIVARLNALKGEN